MKWLKKFNLIDSNKQNLEKKIEDVDKKRPDTSKFIKTHEFNRQTKTNLNARMAEVSKNLSIKR